jgi:hypothetical protein
MPVNSQPNDTLFVNQLWCLVIGSDILITLSDRPADDLLGNTIEKRTDHFRQPLRIEIAVANNVQHSMSISSKTPWVDFFRHVIYTVHGNLIRIMDYELVDQAGEVVTTERWADFARATKSSILKFYLVEKKTPVSRSSSVSCRRSSHSGIKKLLLLDYANRGDRRGSKASASRYHTNRYDGDSSSSERVATSKRSSIPRRLNFSRSLVDKTPASTEDVSSRITNAGLDAHKAASPSQAKPPGATYKKVQVEDGSESSVEYEIDRRAFNGSLDATPPYTGAESEFNDKIVPNDEHNPDQDNLSNLDNREISPETRFVFWNRTNYRRNSSPESYSSRSSSPSNSTDDSSYARGRSRTQKRHDRKWESPDFAHDSSSRPEVRFQRLEWHSSSRDSAETSPFGSSNATKVDVRPVRTTVPFFLWKQNREANTLSSEDAQEQFLIKHLDQIDERISVDPISRYYLKVPELTMDDVLSRQESLQETSSEKDSTIVPSESSQINKLSGQGTIDIRTSNMFAYRSTRNQTEKIDEGGDKDDVQSVEALGTNLGNYSEIKNKALRVENEPVLDNAPRPTNVLPGRGANEQANFSQTQALGLVSHDKALTRQLVDMSRQIVSSFIPDTGGSVIHVLLKRLWGCVDIMCLVGNPSSSLLQSSMLMLFPNGSNYFGKRTKEDAIPSARISYVIFLVRSRKRMSRSESQPRERCTIWSAKIARLPSLINRPWMHSIIYMKNILNVNIVVLSAHTMTPAMYGCTVFGTTDTLCGTPGMDSWASWKISLRIFLISATT